MSYEDIGEITTLVTDTENSLSALRERMERHFDLFTLEPYQSEDAEGKKRGGYQAYTSTRPRNFFDKVLDGLNRAALTIQIQLPEDASLKEKEAASKGELFLFGALAEIDRRLARQGEPPLREGLGFLMCLRGWYAVRALVYMPKDGQETVFDVQAWDPLGVTWEQGTNGLLWANRKRPGSKAQIESEWGLVIKGKNAEVLDFYDTEMNCVIIEDAFAKKPREHNIGHVPIVVGAVGSMPSLQVKTGESAVEYQGDSVWAAGEGVYKPFNRYVSWLMDSHARSIAGSLVTETEDGNTPIVGDPYVTFAKIPLKRGDKLYPLVLPPVPPETAAILQILSEDDQRSSLPYPLAYGGTKEAMSGRALSMLQDATMSVYTPRTGAMARAFTWICEELLIQYAQKGIKPFELRGFGKDGKFFQAQIKPEEIKPQWFVSVVVEPKMPRDETEAIMNALAATQSRGPGDMPLMSKQTARESGLLLQDPTAEQDKILEEMGEALIIPEKIAAALIKRGRPEDAKLVMNKLRGGSQAPALPPELLKPIIEVLVQSGQPQLAEGLLKALGIGAPGAAGPGQEPSAAPPPGGVALGPGQGELSMPGGPGMMETGGVPPGPPPV